MALKTMTLVASQFIDSLSRACNTKRESGPIRVQHLVTYSGMPKTCHYFIYEPLRRANDVACMDQLIVACYMGMSESIRTAGVPGIEVFKKPL